jgi:hypothetical protein
MAFIFMVTKGKVMKKLCLLGLVLCIFTLQSKSVLAQEVEESNEAVVAEEDNENSLLVQTLSQVYGAPVEVKIDEQNCEVRFPKIDITELVFEEDEQEKDTVTAREKITGTFDETIAKCRPADAFNGMQQYIITNSSSSKILAQLYNNSALSFVKNVNVKSFSEEMTVVPQIGLVSAYKMHLNDASYTETDPTTGLKSEIGNLKDLSVNTSVTQKDGHLRYLTDTQFNNFNMVLPMMSMQIASGRQVAEATYNVTDLNEFDYTNMLQNFLSLNSSRTRAKIKGIKFKSDPLNMGISCDIEVKNQADLKNDGNMDSTGNMLIDNLVYTGGFIEKHQQPKSISMSFSLNDIKMQTLARLAEIQLQAIEKGDDSEIDEEEMINILDDVLNTAKLQETIAIKFTGAGVFVDLNLQRKDNYLQGDGEINIKNLYNVFPELKECRLNPKTPQCTQNPMVLMGSDFIDISKNNQTVKIKFTDKGIFINGKKTGEAIEIDLHKILQEDDDKNDTSADADDTENVDLEDTEAAPEEFNSIENEAEADTDLEQFDLGEPLDIDKMMAE